jgi:hypothetical protein
MTADRIVDQDSHALAEAQLRWPAVRERLLSIEGPPLSPTEVSAALGVSAGEIDVARQKHRIVGVPDGVGSFVYPRWQFRNDRPLPGVQKLVKALRDDDPWTLVIFLLVPNARLDDETPLDALRRGDVDRVVRAATAYGEHGAA